MNLTTNEWEIIDHRLGAPDCIADALTDGDEIDPPILKSSHQEVIDRAWHLSGYGQASIDFESKLDREIIIDCLDGCTFFADIDDAVASGELSKGKCLAYHKAANSLEKKFNQSIPRY